MKVDSLSLRCCLLKKLGAISLSLIAFNTTFLANASASTTANPPELSDPRNKSEGTLTTLPDGSTILTRKDGTQYITYSDGSTLEQYADGSEQLIKVDGSSILKRKDGSKIIKTQDGLLILVHPDGRQEPMGYEKVNIPLFKTKLESLKQ